MIFYDNGANINYIEQDEHNHSGSHSGADPHTWSSPKEVFLIIDNMYEALVDLNPNHRDLYETNLIQLRRKVQETDSILQSYLSQSKQKAFIIYHPALTYLARDYGLKQYSIENEGKEPSPDQLKRLVDITRQENIRTIFIQQEFDRKNAEIIAKETNCRLVVINPLSYHWDEEIIRIAKALADE